VIIDNSIFVGKGPDSLVFYSLVLFQDLKNRNKYKKIDMKMDLNWNLLRFANPFQYKIKF